jgi:putative ABC transport system ATP-binding protein
MSTGPAEKARRARGSYVGQGWKTLAKGNFCTPRSSAAENSEVLIRASELAKEYPNGGEPIRVLRGVSLSVRRGEMLAIMGPSGSGKSTLLFILGLLLQPTRGVYIAAGSDVSGMNRSAQAEFRRKEVGFVFQSCNLIESSTVYENIEFPLIYAGVKRKERAPRIREALTRVNLANRMHHPASRLSGGEQQRVAVARAMVNRPRIILADEPTGQLDRNNGRLVLDCFEQFVAGGETAMVIVTHDPEVAARCTRVCLLEDGAVVGAG